MLDRIMVLISLGLLIAFCAVLITFVGRIDLALVIAVCVLMGVYDLLFYSFRKK
ncbi:MAG: hypothetical protein KTR19_04435 [Hyphomicrobiales bacterium]|nr:hypothetical protein [Hyphomicrobiales bacterium]